MQLNNTAIAGIVALWLGTAAGAYLLGKYQTHGTDGVDGSSGAAAASPGTGSGGGKAGSGKAGRASGDKDAAEKPMTVKQILAKMKVAMRSGAMQNPSAMMKVMGLLDKIRPEDIQEALAEAEALTDPQQKMMLYMALLGKWAENDGPAAMKYAEDHSKSMGMMAQMAKMSVAGAWAEKDPEAVWKWYKESGEKDSGGMFGGSMVLSSLFSNLAVNDPDLAFRRLEEVEGPGKMMAMSGMFMSVMFDDDKRQLVLKKVESMQDEQERTQAKQMMLSQWTMMAPEQAVEWVKTQPEGEQKYLRESVGSMLMMSDPKKGAAFMMEGATDEDKSKRYSRIIGQWAHMDTNAAGTWLREQPQGPHLDEARVSFVSAASMKDPESAMVWAGTITNPDMRVGAVTNAYSAWKKKDAAAAEAALQNSGLTAEQMDAARKSGAVGSAPAPGPALEVPK